VNGSDRSPPGEYRPGENHLGERAEAVFDTLLNDRAGDLHPQDRDEAMAFWNWIGDRPRPALPAPAAGLSRARRWAAAAALAVMLAGSGAIWVGRSGADHPIDARYAAGHAERRVVRLTDGSTVTLAADSRIEVHFTSNRRHLRLLAGEALFEVAHDTAKPFVVETPHGQVTAVGTAFDVELGRDDAEVTVVEGTIRIALPGEPGGASLGVREPIVKLATKGERVAFGTATRDGARIGFISQSAPADSESAIAWTRGQLVFHGEPLSEVIHAINRYIAKPADQLTLKDDAAARTPVFGIVNQGDPAAIRDLIDNPTAVGRVSDDR